MAAGADFRSRIIVEGAQEATAAIKQFGNAGEEALNQVDKGTKTATQSLRSFTRETTGMRKASGQLFKNFSDMGRSLETVGGLLGSTLGGVAGGLIGVGLAKVIGGISSALDGVSERLTKIRDQAAEIGVRPIELQARQELAARAGQDPDVAAKSLAHTTDLIAKARTEVKELGVEGVKTLRGMGDLAEGAAGHIERFGTTTSSVVRTLRGSQGPMFDLSDPLKTVGVNLKNYKDNALDTTKAQRDLRQGFLDTVKGMDPLSAKVNELSKRLLGIPAATAFKTLPGEIANLTAKMAELEKSERGATDTAISMVERRNAAYAAQSEKVTEFTAAITNWYIELDAKGTEALNRFAERFSAQFVPTLKSAWESFVADFSQLFVTANWEKLWNDFAAAGIKALSSIGEWAGTVFTAIGQKIADFARSIANIVGSLPGRIGSAIGTTPLPFASGGSVPGSGHGDTVPAMLTPGEFVMRRAVVDALGAPFFAALNGGGGSLLPRSRFATGGLVADSISGGQPVHLHIGGHSFPLNGSANVVSALVVEAHRQHIRSTGQKPSWYGGR